MNFRELKTCKFAKLSSYKIHYSNVHKKDLYFKWTGSDSTEKHNENSELQQV